MISRPTTHRPLTRKPAVWLLLAAAWVALIGGAVLAPTAPAYGATAYRFWGYFQYTGGAWTFATTGPDATTPADGAIEGWRYAVSDMGSTRYPRVTPSFEAICGGTAKETGKKRVAVVVDFGRVADAEDGKTTPPGARTTCVAVPDTATGAAVLAAADAPVRVDKGLVCAVAGYPATGCGGEVAQLTAAMTAPDEALPAATASSSTSGTPAAKTSTHPAETVDSLVNNITPVMLAVVGLIAMAAIVWTVARRNTPAREGDPDR